MEKLDIDITIKLERGELAFLSLQRLCVKGGRSYRIRVWSARQLIW